MPLTAQEQYLLELINRGRLNPAAEAARYGIDLNASLAAGTISTAAKQVLAPNELLESAAIKHSQWMLATNTFSHTGVNGSTIATRANAEGYKWNLLGENIAVWGTSGTLNMTAAIDAHHKGLFLSAGHRTNLMNATLSEVGLAQESGRFKFSGGGEFNASMLTEFFGAKTGSKFLTGVAYNDLNKDGMYSVGEGRMNIGITAAGVTDITEAAGGYSIAMTVPGNAWVSGRAGAMFFSVNLDFSQGNVKLDVVNGQTLHVSTNIGLSGGIQNVDLLGVANLKAYGNSLNNVINGNFGANVLLGAGGNDVLDGRAGNDHLVGGVGNDTLMGSAGDDRLFGDAGSDRLVGGAGRDTVTGGLGADQFVFSNNDGADVFQDFNLAQGDRLHINDDLWTGQLTTAQVVTRFATVSANGVVFNFGDGDSITLSGVNSIAGLAGGMLLI